MPTASTEIEEISTITSKGQTTVPKAVRDRLGLDSGSAVRWVVRKGEVVLRPAAVNEDPAIGAFLALLARDVATGKVSPMPQDLVERARSLIKGVRVVPDAQFDEAVPL
jgi:antitoxin PrlF